MNGELKLESLNPIDIGVNMPTIKVTVDVEVDGKRIGNFPVSRRIQITEEQAFQYLAADSAGYHSIPASEIAVVKALVFTADKALTLRLQGQSDAGLVVNENGIVALVDVTLNSGALTNATLNNTSGSTAIVEGVVAG